MRKRRIRRGIGTLLGILAFLLLAAFATGRLSIATTRGISMLPAFHTGDLAILRAAGSYHVGEIVAYRSPLLHTTVLHRIIAENDGLFTFKGDNNDFVDPVRLPVSAISGTLLLHIPRGGALIEWLQNPLHLIPTLAFALGIVAFGGTRRKKRREGGATPRTLEPSTIGTCASVLVACGLAVAAASGLLLAMGLAAPASRSSSTSVPYTEQLTFGYSASAPRGTTYPIGVVSTGAPIFLKLVHALAVSASYQLDTAAATKLTGTIGLQAELVESDGWSHVIATSPPIAFTGTVANASLNIPIKAALAALTQSMAETGVGNGGESIVVSPAVTVNGSIAGEPFSGSLAPSLTFAMSPLELNLLPGTAGTGAAQFPQLSDKHSGDVQQPTTLPGEVGIIGHDMGVGTARTLGTAGLALGLALLLAGLAFFKQHRAIPEDERIRQRIKADLVPIGNDPAESMRGVVNVATMAALASLAQRYDVAMLEREEGVDHIYYAVVGDLVYRYRREPGWRADANVVLLNTTSTRPITPLESQSRSG